MILWLTSHLPFSILQNAVTPVRTLGSIAQLGEHLPYKQRVIGSSPIVPTKNAGVAQLVEQLICNQQVGGSIPSTSSKNKKPCDVCHRFFINQFFIKIISSYMFQQSNVQHILKINPQSAVTSVLFHTLLPYICPWKDVLLVLRENLSLKPYCLRMLLKL